MDSLKRKMLNAPIAPVPIASPNKEGSHKFTFDEENKLKRILLQPEIQDLNVAVISIAGALREGKSFLLNLFLRYMEHNAEKLTQHTVSEKLTHHLRSKLSNCQSSQRSWLDDDNTSLGGFHSRYGTTACTSGILMWPEIFAVNLPNGEKVAVIFLDTQGTFDHRSSDKEDVVIFALSTLLSSVQIFNVFHLLRKDHLQHLELFSAYARLLTERTRRKPFQKLQILVRDWRMPEEKKHGSEDGRQYFEEVIQDSQAQAQQRHQHASGNFIQTVYDDIQCFLMPSPGDKVTSATFDGKLSDVDGEFKRHLAQLASNLLAPENLVVKEIAGTGQKIKVKDWFSYMENCVDVFNGDGIPSPRSILDATAEINIQSTIEYIKKTYNQLMWEDFEKLKPYMTTEERDREHFKNKIEALKQYDDKPKIGSDALCESGRIKLIEIIETDYISFKMNNELTKRDSCKEAVTAGTATYEQEMKACLEEDNDGMYLSCDEFAQLHETAKENAFEEFKKGCKEADVSTNEYRLQLEKAIKIGYRNFEMNNTCKKMVSSKNAANAGTIAYEHELLTHLGDSTSNIYFSRDEFRKLHEIVKERAFEAFKEGCKEAADVTNEYRIQLERNINNHYRESSIKNDRKRKKQMVKKTMTAAAVGGIAGAAVGVEFGAEIGAFIGMVGGPPGVVTGGAVGGAIGGILGAFSGAFCGVLNAAKAPRNLKVPPRQPALPCNGIMQGNISRDEDVELMRVSEEVIGTEMSESGSDEI